MKRLFIILTIFTMAFGTLLGADKKNDSTVLKGDWKDASDTVFIIYHDDNKNYTDEQNVLVKEYAEVFAKRLQEIIGGHVEAVSMPINASTLSRCAIHIGEKYDNSLYVEYLEEQNGGLLSFMPKSDEEWAKYIGSESTYSIYANGSDLHINASDEWALYWAIDDFLKKIETAEEFTFDDETKILAAEGHKFPTPTDLMGKGLNPYFAVTEKITELPYSWDNVNLYDYSEGMQGGGTDGKYAYVAGDGSGDLARIFKYSLPEWELVEISKPIIIKHGNDISYIEDSDLLLIAHCVDDDQGFSYVDPDTFEIVGVGSFPVNCWGLEYDDVKERFVVEADWINYIFDKDFNLVEELHYGDSEGTPQSLYIEDDYIFDVRWDMNWLRNSGIPFKDCDFQNYIMIHDYENVYVEKAYIPVVTGEPEFIFRHGNMYYIGYLHNVVNGKENPVGVIYEFLMLPEIWWTN